MRDGSPPHVLVNGLSVSSGGGYTVCRELVRGLATARPGWRWTIAMTEGNANHEPMRSEKFPANVSFLWAPANAGPLVRRAMYENVTLVHWARAEGVSAVLQLNGMMVPRLKLPTISHAQDPMPYLPRTWEGRSHPRLAAMMRRRAVKYALVHAGCMGFTSVYLRDLICGMEKITPKRVEVFYNAVPDEWCSRDDAAAPPLESRPMEILTVSDVTLHKRQHLVADAVRELRREKGLENLTYRVIGRFREEGYAARVREPAGAASSVSVSTSSNGEGPIRLMGRQSQDELAAAFKSARCFAFMSICESFGIPPLEAMSFGAPVVSSDCCAMPEVLGDAALFVPIDDVAGLKNALRRVLTDNALAAELRRKGFEQFRKFRWSDTVSTMAARFDELVGRVH
jgi:glycosyltransferase involved in cell wall biosynthesis